MANKKHLKILKQGVEEWNRWRLADPMTRPDLSNADLSRANIETADLYGATLSDSILREARLSRATLERADLSGADLRKADLRGAFLRRANLIGAVLNRADLSEADLSEALIGSTVLADVDLSVVKGLDTIKHLGSSTIGIDTIYRSHGQISEVFLRGAGVPDTFISYIGALTGKATQYYSCFLSYSSQDEAFAERLHTDLQAVGIRCWFAPKDMEVGTPIRQTIDASMRLHDKLLLVLSKSTVTSEWIRKEVEAALEEEREKGRPVLFPIRLDNAVMDAEEPWILDIRRTRYIGDFSLWKDHDHYQKALSRLVRDLTASATAETDKQERAQ